MTMVLYPRYDKDRLYESRRDGGGRIVCIADCVQGYEDCIKKSQEILITVVNTCFGKISTGRKKQQKLGSGMEIKKNNCIDISRNKLARLHSRRRGYI